MRVPPQYEKPAEPGVFGGFENTVHIYHVVAPEDDFLTSAEAVFARLREAQERFPNADRILYIDIEGHKGQSAGFDGDMFEFQQEFLQGALGPYLTALATPLQSLFNPREQQNDLPDSLQIGPPR